MEKCTVKDVQMDQRVYLPALLNRRKWAADYRNLEKGDLFMISVEHAARSHWSLGRIVDIYPGKDKIVTPSIETHLAVVRGLPTKTFLPKCVNEKISTERRS